MKHAIGFHATKNSEHMELAYAVQLSARDAQVLRPIGSELKVHMNLVPPLDLCDARGKTYEEDHKRWFTTEGRTQYATIHGQPEFNDNGQPTWKLSDFMPYTIFRVTQIREAYVYLRMIAAHIENAMILAMPLAPYYGFTRVFDIRFDVPKEITNFELYRRSILAHGE